MNPLDAICDKKRNDAVCVSNLKNAKKIDEEVLAERPDIKIFLPFRFYFYRVEELFRPQTYNRFLGMQIASFGIQLTKFFFYSCRRRRPFNFPSGRDFLRFTASATSLTVRWHRFKSILQRRQSPSWLRAKLHVHTQSWYSAECHRWSCSSRWSATRQSFASIPLARTLV